MDAPDCWHCIWRGFGRIDPGSNQILGLLINGNSTGVFGLNNHLSAIGDSLILGYAQAGDLLTFILKVQETEDVFSSNTASNTDGFNHVYAADASATGQTPAGVFIGFEDLLGGGDKNYNDGTYVITNVAVNNVAAVPGPEAGAGLGAR